MNDILVYNDFLLEEKKKIQGQSVQDTNGDEDDFYSNLFFTLANTKKIGYRVNDKDLVIVQQNVDAANTTGGIVWESAYLLLEYLVKSQICRSLASNLITSNRLKVIDLGAGTGLLGLSLSRMHCDVTVTEFNDPDVNCSVFDLLSGNVLQHNKKFIDHCGSTQDVGIFSLDWKHGDRDINNWLMSCSDASVDFDLVLGTDVLFTPSLVLPLLNVASILTKPKTGTCIFCMQIRCRDSHELFLENVEKYFDNFRDISDTVYNTDGCAWGNSVECLVFEMTGGKNSVNTFSPPVKITKRRDRAIAGTSCSQNKKKKLS